MNLTIIRTLCEKRPGGIRQLAIDAGMSEPNIHRCIRLNVIQAGDLEKISHLLGVPINIFFDESPVIPKPRQNPTEEKAKNKELEARVEEIERELSLLKQALAKVGDSLKPIASE